jgi:hypothetical protein
MEIKTELHSDELRAKYDQLVNQELPQRAKGIPHKNIGGPLVALTFSAISCIVIYFMMNGRGGTVSMFLVSFAAILLFLYLPEQFYDRRARTKRYSFRKYPALKAAINQLLKKENSEVCTNDVPVLYIDGAKLFLVGYVVRQKWWKLQPAAKLTGWALLNEKGQMIRSTQLFAKAFLTLMHAYTGGTRVQTRDFRDQAELLEQKIRYVWRAEKFLSWQKKRFEKSDKLEVLQKALDSVQYLNAAIDDILTIFNFRDQLRKSIGFSFGLEFYYEDAIHTEEVYRAFAEYMKTKHFSRIVELNNLMADLRDVVNKASSWPLRYFTYMAILKIRDVGISVLGWAKYYEHDGIFGKDEWIAYVDRLRYADLHNAPILNIGEFSEEYPYNGQLYHSDIFETKK